MEPPAKVIGERGQIRTRKPTQDDVGFGSCVCVFLKSVHLISLTDKGSNTNVLHGWDEPLENQHDATVGAKGLPL